MAAKTDMERIGVFSESGYTTISDPYAARSSSKSEYMCMICVLHVYIDTWHKEHHAVVRISCCFVKVRVNWTYIHSLVNNNKWLFISVDAKPVWIHRLPPILHVSLTFQGLWRRVKATCTFPSPSRFMDEFWKHFFALTVYPVIFGCCRLCNHPIPFTNIRPSHVVNPSAFFIYKFEHS